MKKYQLPDYIINANISRQNIDYAWDDEDILMNLDMAYGENIVEKVVDISWRGRMMILTGVYEWVLGCLKPVFDNPLFYEIAQAAHCCVIDRNYLIPFYQYDSEENSRNNFLGPIDGALWCAGFSALISNFYLADDTYDLNRNDDLDDEFDDNVYTVDTCLSDIVFLIPLAIHILPSDKITVFKSWLDGVIARLLEFYPMAEADPFDNLFEYQDEKAWIGDYIAREVLDLDIDYNPTQAQKYCDSYLKSVDYSANRFLVSANKLKNKIKVPYRLLS